MSSHPVKDFIRAPTEELLDEGPAFRASCAFRSLSALQKRSKESVKAILRSALADQGVLPQSGASTPVSPPPAIGLTFEQQMELSRLCQLPELERIRLERDRLDFQRFHSPTKLNITGN